MSSMLEEAIIDAEALKEAAKKSAEEKIIEHFSKDIKEAVDLILEQDPMMDPMMGAGMDPMMAGVPGMGTTMAPTSPYAPGTAPPMATAGPSLIDIEAEGDATHAGEFIVKQAPFAATTSDKDIVSIDLNRLEEAIQASVSAFDDTDLMEEDEEDEEYEIDESFELDEDDDLMEEDDDDVDAPIDEGRKRKKKKKARRTGDEDLHEDLHEDFDDESLEEMIREMLSEEDDDDLTEDVDDGDPIEEELDDDQESLEEMIRSILAEEGSLQETTLKPEDCPKGDGYKECVRARTKRQKEVGSKEATRRAGSKEHVEKYCEDFDERERPEGCTPKEARFKKGAAPLVREHKQLNNKVKLLEQKLNKYQEVFPQLKQQLEESSLQNARLHYQNRVLNSDSLNERQKDRLVETISKAKTVEEAKIIYETLQSAVGASALKSQPKSLNEVVTKRSSAFMPRKEEKRGDPLAARMKALAGITDK